MVFALLFGAGNGVMTIVRGTIPVEFFGRAHYGAVNGALAAPVLIAKAFGPLVAALAWAWTRDYDSVALMLAAVGAVLAGLLRLRDAMAPSLSVTERGAPSTSRRGPACAPRS